MSNNVFSSIVTLILRFINVISIDNLERVRTLKQFSLVFKEAYLSGEIGRHCTVTTSAGNPEFRHQLSTFYFRTGFKITIENDHNLNVEDFEEIIKYVVQRAPSVRRLMCLGYDTLVIKAKNHLDELEISLKVIEAMQHDPLPVVV